MKTSGMLLTDSPCVLRAHPRTPAPMIRTFDVTVTRTPDGALGLAYRLFGDMARVRLPGPCAADRCDGLWEHTCFEAFIAATDATFYREFNFSPAGPWAVYDFTDTRKPLGFLPPVAAPEIHVSTSAGRLELNVRLDLAALPETLRHAELAIGLSAVLESTDTLDDARSYWALTHPSSIPDFHHRDGFILTVPAYR